MTEHSQNSQVEEKPKTRIENLKNSLASKGVQADHLACFVTDEFIIGEVCGWEGEDPKSVPLKETLQLKNPKIILNFHDVGPNGVSINFMMTDYGMIESGKIWIQHANIAFRVSDLDEDSQASYFGIYLDFLNRKAENKARASGLVLPNPRLGMGLAMPQRGR